MKRVVRASHNLKHKYIYIGPVYDRIGNVIIKQEHQETTAVSFAQAETNIKHNLREKYDWPKNTKLDLLDDHLWKDN